MSQIGRFFNGFNLPINSITGNVGGAVLPVGGNVFIIGGNNITTTGVGDTLTIDVTGTTNHAVQIGNASGSLTSLPVGSTGQILQSAGAGSNPAWTTATYPSLVSQGSILYGFAANVVGTLVKNINATRYLANTGPANSPQWDQINLTNGVTGVLPLANGGTNTNTFTVVDGTVYFDGTSLVTTATGTAGQVLTSGGVGVAPSYQNAAFSLIIPFTPITVLDTPYDATVTDYFIDVDTSGGPVTVRLPNAPSTGRMFVVKDAVGTAAASNITVTAVGGVVLIDGATSFVMNTAYEAAQFVFSGAAYRVF